MFVGMPPELNEIEIFPETGSTITDYSRYRNLQAAVENNQDFSRAKIYVWLHFSSTISPARDGRSQLTLPPTLPYKKTQGLAP